MDSSNSDHSVSKSISIPQWMKPRLQEGFDAEISTLSPPNQDDSFFYIPYSKLTNSSAAFNEPSASGISTETTQASFGKIADGASASSSLASKHTTPCLKFLQEKTMDIADLTGFSKDDVKVQKPIKSFGTDDGFKSEAAQCGHSVVQVAQQMIADRLVGRPRKLGGENNKISSGEPEMPHVKQRVRRGSKSLPASPLSTPDSTPQIHRKNRYFTGAFVEPSEESSKFPGGWLVAGLLGVHRENFSESQSDLASDTNNNGSLLTKKSEENKSSAESDSKEKKASPLHESRSAASLIRLGNTPSENAAKKTRPKPSELREMNFWSPTSM